MDITTLFQAPIVESVEGVEISFARVPLRSVATIMATVKGKKREQAKKDAEDARLDPVQTYRALQLIADREFITGEIIDYIDTTEGADAVLLVSLQRSKVSDSESNTIIESMSFTQGTNLALRLTGVKSKQATNLTDIKTEKKAADGSPPAFGAPAVGSVPPLDPKGFAPANS